MKDIEKEGLPTIPPHIMALVKEAYPIVKKRPDYAWHFIEESLKVILQIDDNDYQEWLEAYEQNHSAESDDSPATVRYDNEEC